MLRLPLYPVCPLVAYRSLRRASTALFGVKVKGRGGDFFSTDAAEQVCAEKTTTPTFNFYTKKNKTLVEPT